MGKLEEMILAEANRKLRTKKDIHHNVCVELVELQKACEIPMGYLVYFAIGKNAHRLNIFEQGYKEIQREKAEQIIYYCNAFKKKYGKLDDKVVHAMTRYYEVSNNKRKFNELLKASAIEKYKTATELLALLCKDEAIYNDRGVVIEIKKCKRK